MAKPSIFVTLPKKWFPFLPPSLEKKFNVEYWEGDNQITKEELVRKVKGKFGIYTISRILIDEDVIKAAGESLKVVSIRSAGHENVDVEALKAHGIKVGYLGSVNTEATAEMAVTLLLAVGRRIKEHIKSPGWSMGREHLSSSLHNSTVGIVGCGSIGTSIARKVKSFDIKRLMYFARSEKAEVNAMGGEFCSLPTLMAESDFVITALSLNKDTEKIISKKIIDLMKPTAIFVNVARGGVVDQDALTEALRLKKIGGAGLDATTPEPLPIEHLLYQMDNVVVTPHRAACTADCMKQADVLAAENLIAVLEGKEMPMELKIR